MGPVPSVSKRRRDQLGDGESEQPYRVHKLRFLASTDCTHDSAETPPWDMGTDLGSTESDMSMPDLGTSDTGTALDMETPVVDLGSDLDAAPAEMSSSPHMAGDDGGGCSTTAGARSVSPFAAMFFLVVLGAIGMRRARRKF